MPGQRGALVEGWTRRNRASKYARVIDAYLAAHARARFASCGCSKFRCWPPRLTTRSSWLLLCEQRAPTAALGCHVDLCPALAPALRPSRFGACTPVGAENKFTRHCRPPHLGTAARPWVRPPRVTETCIVRNWPAKDTGRILCQQQVHAARARGPARAPAHLASGLPAAQHAYLAPLRMKALILTSLPSCGR